MKVHTVSTKDKVYAAWLKSELFRMQPHLSAEQISIIENPNLNDEQENLKREDLLLNIYGRKAIMDHIPSDMEWLEVEIEEADIDNLYLLAIWDWFIDTGKTFKLSQVPANLSSSHGHRVSGLPPGAADHKTKIDEMSRALNNGIQDIVMIASSRNGPFTIIDGTH